MITMLPWMRGMLFISRHVMPLFVLATVVFWISSRPIAHAAYTNAAPSTAQSQEASCPADMVPDQRITSASNGGAYKTETKCVPVGSAKVGNKLCQKGRIYYENPNGSGYYLCKEDARSSTTDQTPPHTEVGVKNGNDMSAYQSGSFPNSSLLPGKNTGLLETFSIDGMEHDLCHTVPNVCQGSAGGDNILDPEAALREAAEEQRVKENPVTYIEQQFGEKRDALYQSPEAQDVYQRALMRGQVEPTNVVDRYGRTPEADALTKSELAQEAAKNLGGTLNSRPLEIADNVSVVSSRAQDTPTTATDYYLNTDTGKVFMRTMTEFAAPGLPVDQAPPPHIVDLDLITPEGSYVPIPTPDTPFQDMQWSAVRSLSPTELSVFEGRRFGDGFDTPIGYRLDPATNMYAPVTKFGSGIEVASPILPENLGRLNQITYEAYGLHEAAQSLADITEGRVTAMLINPDEIMHPKSVLSGHEAAARMQNLEFAVQSLPPEVYKNGAPVVVQMYPGWRGVTSIPSAGDTDRVTAFDAQGNPMRMESVQIYTPNIDYTFTHEYAHAQKWTGNEEDTAYMDRWGYNAYGNGYNDIYRGRSGAQAIITSTISNDAPPPDFSNTYAAAGGIDEDWATMFDDVVNRPAEIYTRSLSDSVLARKIDTVEAFLYNRSGGTMDAQYWNDRTSNYSAPDLSPTQVTERNTYLQEIIAPRTNYDRFVSALPSFLRWMFLL